MDHPNGGYRRALVRSRIELWITMVPARARDCTRGTYRHLLRRPRPLHGGVREDMTFDLIVGLVLSLAALVYLTYAMLRPEKF